MLYKMLYFEKIAGNKEDITMSNKLKEIVQSTGLGCYIKPYSSIRENKQILGYNQILGKKIKNLTDKILDYRNNPAQLNVEEPIISNDEKEVEKTIKLLYETIFKKKTFNYEIERKLMLNGLTFPIKINFLENEFIKESFYVKKPDTNRIIGSFLYNIIRDDPLMKFAFNEKMFIEPEVRGNNLLQEYEELLLTIPEYRVGLGKAAAQSEFLGLYEDVVADRNRIVNDKYETILFDFDAIFEPLKQGQRGNHIMLDYAEKKQVDSLMVQSYRNEKKNIAKKIMRNKHVVLPFVEQANMLKDNNYGTIKNKIQEFSGHKCLKDYIIAQTRNYSQ